MKYGTLHLIPNSISPDKGKNDVPDSLFRLIKVTKFWVVENTRTTRRYLKSLDKSIDIDSLQFIEMDKHTDHNESLKALTWLTDGHDVGLMSEAGLPGIADPGNELILQAHQEGIRVVPHAGPSSMLLGLIASGLNGQRFMFHGYLPVKSNDRNHAVKKLEKQSIRDKASQIIMETPYRNEQLFESLVSNLHGNSWLTVACDIDSPDAFIRTLRVKTWKKAPQVNLHKRPAVFVLQGFDE
ncbi:MAG: SAM-dependent methyltransferase [Bacteroidales bacterium]